MNIYKPNYYDKFNCIADKCRHNCCIGWEIDIDDETLKKYDVEMSSLSDRFAKCISRDGDTPHFILTKDERCPFLNEKNLCDIITLLGEEYLCRICGDHPRFRSFFSDRTEIGLGLSCEEAARIILTQKERFFLVEEKESEGESFEFAEFEILQKRDDIIAILQERTKPLNERVEDVLLYLNTDYVDISLREWAEHLSEFEILDEGWRECIDTLSKWDEKNKTFTSEEYEIALEQLIVYFIYRHLSGALEDGCIIERVIFALVSVQIINALCIVKHEESGQFSMEDMIEIARMYSSEIEYCVENTEEMLDLIYFGL